MGMVAIGRDELRPGDLVFFNTLRRTFSHVGIYIGDGKFIHSPRAGGAVRVEDMGVRYWNARFTGARRASLRRQPLTTGTAGRAALPRHGACDRHNSHMAEKSIPLADLRYRARIPVVPSDPVAPSGLLSDRLGRPLHDLRISVTDRCNFRCSYCMPQGGVRQGLSVPAARLAAELRGNHPAGAIFVAHGVRKIRLTGGEPLLRKNLEVLVGQLAALRTADGAPLDLTLTTNGSLLARKAQALKDAGLQRVTVSLDALDDAVFRRMNDVDFPVAEVLDGIEQAHRVGLGPIKVNMVVKRGINDQQILPMARHFRGTRRRAALHRVHGRRRHQRLAHGRGAAVGRSGGAHRRRVCRWCRSSRRSRAKPRSAGAMPTARGEIGVISPVTQAFCGDCNRARLSTEGKLYLCLFADRGHDLRALLRGGASDGDIAGAIGQIWHGRDDRYSELRGAARERRARSTMARLRRAGVEMSYIGG